MGFLPLVGKSPDTGSIVSGASAAAVAPATIEVASSLASARRFSLLDRYYTCVAYIYLPIQVKGHSTRYRLNIHDDALPLDKWPLCGQ